MEKGQVFTRMGYDMEYEISAMGEPMVRVVKSGGDGRKTAMTFIESDLDEMRRLMRSGAIRCPVQGVELGS